MYCLGLDRLDGEFGIDRHPQPHLVKVLARGDFAASEGLHFFGTGVDQTALDIPEAVVTSVATANHLPCMD